MARRDGSKRASLGVTWESFRSTSRLSIPDLTASRDSMGFSAQRVRSPRRRCKLGHGRARGQLYKGKET
uniref:Uncharacterized protein n=1 Tax=Brassica oleracea var. oleracea TaxID=109376 RepID=A0A0D3CFT7_BRAOL